ncbi:MAG: carbohydrate kinase [Prevotella sp.]|nr:carbohydrate kinase [Prevotella sp.]
MSKVIGIGETVLEIIFKNGQPTAAVPGGSTFNAIISLGRSGVSTTFISETGNDRVGNEIINFLQKNGVNSDNVNVFPDSKSPISLAFLNEKNDAEYLFYKDHPHDQLDFIYPDVQPDDIVLFGSYYAVNPVIRPQVKGFLDYAHTHGAILYYDVNFRPSHKNEVMKLTPNLLENLELADFVRGSHEDFEVLYRMDNADKVYNAEISFYCKDFIYTHGAEPVEVRAQGGMKKSYPVTSMQAISTIGAGDNFNAGFIYGLLKYGITHKELESGLSETQWDNLISCAQRFSADCCKDIYNYISPEFGTKMKEEMAVTLHKNE